MSASQEKPICLLMPELKPSAPVRMKISFNTLAGSRPPEIIGELQDKAGFSKSLGWDEKAPKQELYIKAPGTGFYIPPEYAQFIPALEQIKADYYSKFGDDGYCAIGIVQAVIDPSPGTTKPFVQAHKDISPSCLKRDGQAPNHYVYVVSDAEDLQTGFSDYNYTEADIEKIRTADDPDKAQSDILNQDHVQYKSLPGSHLIVAIDSTSAHALANPQEPTQRTALVTAFTGPEMTPPESLLNPYLEAALEKMKQKHNQPSQATNQIG